MRLGGVDLQRTVIGYALSNGAKYSAQEILQGVSRQDLVGWEGSDITLRCKWHQQLLDLWETHDAIFAFTESGEFAELEFDNGDNWGSFIVAKITMTPTSTLPDETWIACDVEIVLLDPGTQPDGDMPEDPIAVEGVEDAKSGEPLEDRSLSPATATAAQIARRE